MSETIDSLVSAVVSSDREIEQWKQRHALVLEQLRAVKSKLETSQVALKGAEERAKMLLDAKSHWAERARTAESRLDQVRDLLAHIVVKCHETDESLSILEAPDVRRLDEAYRIAKGHLSTKQCPEGRQFGYFTLTCTREKGHSGDHAHHGNPFAERPVYFGMDLAQPESDRTVYHCKRCGWTGESEDGFGTHACVVETPVQVPSPEQPQYRRETLSDGEYDVRGGTEGCKHEKQSWNIFMTKASCTACGAILIPV